MGDTGGGPSRKICPIISAVSELKQFSDYPKCHSDCAWWDPHNQTCCMRSIAEVVRDAGMTQEPGGLTSDYQFKQDISTAIGGLGDVLSTIAAHLKL